MIYLVQGNTETLTCGPIESADREPVDLSAATVKIIIKRNVDDADNTAVFAQSVAHPESNTVAFILNAANTRAIDPGQYVLGIKIVWDDGTEREIKRDNVMVSKGVFNG